jgi:hypothetical protein
LPGNAARAATAKFIAAAGEGYPARGVSNCSCVTHQRFPREREPELVRAGSHRIAYNIRYLILPWVRVPHLALHILGKMTSQLSHDWERLYGHPVYFAETFIDPGRFRGTCYRAANWKFLGLTTGRGKNDHTYKPNRPIKEVLGLALTPRFRELLQAEAS